MSFIVFYKLSMLLLMMLLSLLKGYNSIELLHILHFLYPFIPCLTSALDNAATNRGVQLSLQMTHFFLNLKQKVVFLVFLSNQG